jgi:hypothetical protein
LTSAGGEPHLNQIKYSIVASVLFQFPFNLFHRFTVPFQPTASQPYFHSVCILNFLYMRFLSFCLSAFLYVCCSVLWFIFRVSARSLFLSLPLSLSLSRSSSLLTSLSRPGLRSFQDACSRPSRQRLNWARNHEKSSLSSVVRMMVL